MSRSIGKRIDYALNHLDVIESVAECLNGNGSIWINSDIGGRRPATTKEALSMILDYVLYIRMELEEDD